MFMKKSFNSFSKQIILILLFCVFNQIKSEEKYYNCSEGFRVKDEHACPEVISCPGEFLTRINLYSCGFDQTFAPISKCKTNLECWNGECVNSFDGILNLCPSHISCPPGRKTKCPDNTCVNSVEECPDYVECPSFNPIRCGNGDCRKSLNDCPSLVHCPDQLPILCNDGSCRAIKQQCQLPTEETTCDDKTMTRCSDGTCTNSKFLCPTLMTCPIGYEKCWDGNCKLKGTCLKKEKTDDESITPKCNNNEIMCQFDFSCASEINDCPTGIICPVDKPVKCWDNSCRDSVENCPAFQNCPSGLKECPDGSCGLGSCGTHITCSLDAPYRCFDNTCKRNPEDCPPQPSCPSETPILCWDGRCLAERGECLAPSHCDNVYRVKCPNGLCSKSSSNCKEENDCPSEFIRCKDGTCRKKLAYCPNESCPVNLPYKCKNGLCVSSLEYCDTDKGCPFYKPQKCPDGSCLRADETCNTTKCNDTQHLCPDGSCLPLNSVCPSANGCPNDTPFRCANGECINEKKSSCSIPLCDKTIPIKCFDGTCVLTSSYCPVERKSNPETGRVICADGTEAHSYDECKPLVLCSENEVRCDDGSCRSSKEDCPKVGSCPNNQKRCPNGSCAKDEDSCPTDNGCPNAKRFRCPKSGFCVSNLDECDNKEDDVGQSNGCPKERPIKCTKYNSCVSNKDECNNLDTICPPGQIMCNNGKCVTNMRECAPYQEENCNFKDNNVSCTDENNVCAKSIGDCFNSINCKVDQPFRCINGECKKYPSNVGNPNGCNLGISCPTYKPYLCADGSCVEKSSFCKSYTPCPSAKPYLCNDKTCSTSKEDCEKNHMKCPATNPLLCPNGICGSGIYDCSENKCPNWSPYYCILGTCSKVPRECQKIEYDAEMGENKINSVCTDDEYICVDGTCRAHQEECPIYPGCVSNTAPFKCYDGGCAENEESCNEHNNKTAFTCPDNSTLCEDGICRKNCSSVEYYGCPNDHPLLCPNGRCVKQIIECVGESECLSTEKPFRCIDGTCASSLANCKIPFREVGGTNIMISLYPQIEVTADLIIGPSNILAGKVEIPADTITNKLNEAAETQIIFRSITRSQIEDTKIEYNKTREDDIRSIYPYADLNDTYILNYQYAVLSSAIEIKLKDPANTKIKGKILLTLLFDFPYKHENLEKTSSVSENKEEYNKILRYTTLPLNYREDVCLAKLNVESRKWECNQLNFNVEPKSDLQLTGELNEEGIYAVVLKLRPNNNKLYVVENWLISNLKLVAIILLIILLFIGILIYIFLRIYRYRLKYKDTKEIYKGFELELTDLQDKSVTGRQGQTYGDVKEGIIYTDNIAFKSTIDSESRKRNTQLEKMFDSYTKKLRLLERNNALLKGQYDNIKSEYDKLNNYKDTLQEGDKIKIEVNINDSDKEI